MFTLNFSAQEVISSQGESYSTSSGKIDFTIGEVVNQTIVGVNNDLTQGFHQPNLTVTGIKDFEENFKAAIFPNPVVNSLSINFEEIDQVYHLEALDLNGKLLFVKQLNSNNNVIDVSYLSAGVYIFALRNQENRILKTFKIKKNK